MQKYFGKFSTIHGLNSDSACKFFLTNCIQITKKCSQKYMYMLVMNMHSHVSNVHVDNEHHNQVFNFWIKSENFWF